MPAATTGLVMRELNIGSVPYRLVFATPFMTALGRFLISRGNPKYRENGLFNCARFRAQTTDTTPINRQDRGRNLVITATTRCQKHLVQKGHHHDRSFAAR